MSRQVLGLDVGGTAIRWATATMDGLVVDEGLFPLSQKNHISTQSGQDQFAISLGKLAIELESKALPIAVLAGITGLRAHAPTQLFLRQSLSQCFSAPIESVRVCNDLVLGALDAWEPGQGHLVYAGTGSVAAHVDASMRLHRVGGLGHLLDDAGGGYWIAKEAFRLIWRQEDEAPGRWSGSPMACRLFEAIGGATWKHTLDAVYDTSRGSLGQLAVHVAATADQDAMAMDILRAAGAELARLAGVLTHRLGPAPVVLAGGASHLHPEIFRVFKEQIGQATPCSHRRLEPHRRAALWAVRPDFRNIPLFAAEGEVPATAL
nr:BadF/BadG/BcrA/BcrD ATPase family protein [uncultured Albidiferax sp.]